MCPGHGHMGRVRHLEHDPSQARTGFRRFEGAPVPGYFLGAHDVTDDVKTADVTDDVTDDVTTDDVTDDVTQAFQR